MKKIYNLLILCFISILLFSCKADVSVDASGNSGNSGNGNSGGFNGDYSKYTAEYTDSSSTYSIGKYEVVRAWYEDIMKGNSYGISATPSICDDANISDGEVAELRPVEHIRIYDAMVFCNLLSEKEGLTPFYTITSPTVTNGSMTSATVTPATSGEGLKGYRLPTYTEWSAAAKDNSTDVFSGATFGYHDSDLLGSFKDPTKQYANDGNNIAIYFDPVLQDYKVINPSAYQNICDPELSKIAWYRRNLSNGQNFIGQCPNTIKKTDDRYYWYNGTQYQFNGSLTFTPDSDTGVLTKADSYGADYAQGGKGFGTHQVGLKNPNAKGIYDMTGNVSEMCATTSQDGFDKAYGGDWRGYAQEQFVTASIDYGNTEDPNKNLNRGQIGFRIYRKLN